MSPSDSRHGHRMVMYSHSVLAQKKPPNRVSQVPRPIFPHALSPITPGGPMAACACCFTIDYGLHHSPAGWSLSTCVTRPNRVHLHYGSRVRSAGLRKPRLLRDPPTLLYVEQAINIVPTFQGTRLARLFLAHQRARKTAGKRKTRAINLTHPDFA